MEVSEGDTLVATYRFSPALALFGIVLSGAAIGDETGSADYVGEKECLLANLACSMSRLAHCLSNCGRNDKRPSVEAE